MKRSEILKLINNTLEDIADEYGNIEYDHTISEKLLRTIEEAGMCPVTFGHTYNDLQSLDWEPEDTK